MLTAFSVPFSPSRLVMVAATALLLLAYSSQAQRFAGFSSQVMRVKTTGSDTAGAAESAKLLKDLEKFGPEARNLLSATGNAQWQAALLADGDFSKSLSDEEGKNSSPKAGSLGFSFTRFKEYEDIRGTGTDRLEVPHLQGNVIVSLGSQGDTLTVDPNPAGGRALNQYSFGQALLLPGSSAQAARSFTGTLLFRPYQTSNHLWLRGLGYNGFLNVTQTRWRYQSINEDVRLTSFSVGIHYTVFDLAAQANSPGSKNSMKFDLLANYSLRSISGDVRMETDILRQAFGSRRYWYSGFEPGVIFSVNSVRVSATFPFYQGRIKGFSRGQFVAGLGFSTALNLSQ